METIIKGKVVQKTGSSYLDLNPGTLGIQSHEASQYTTKEPNLASQLFNVPIDMGVICKSKYFLNNKLIS